MQVDAVVVVLCTGVLVGWVVVSIRRSHELFVLSVDEGRVRVARGRLPPRLFADLCDVLLRQGVRSATIHVLRDGASTRVTSEQLGPGELQMLRNVVGLVPLAEIRAGRRGRG